MRAVVFANGDLPSPLEARALLRPGDYIIAADGGTRHALAVGVVPNAVVGDQDSLSQEDRVRIEAAGARLIGFSARKDETDLELALYHAADVGATQIAILGAVGGRLDQTLANMLLLALPELRGIDVRVVSGCQTAFLVSESTGRVMIDGELGDIVSLIPVGGDARGVTTEGLEWPLCGDTLRFGPARGVSNVLVDRHASVGVRQGQVLCVVISGKVP
jgi:thiamine pyrophosphokinase